MQEVINHARVQWCEFNVRINDMSVNSAPLYYWLQNNFEGHLEERLDKISKALQLIIANELIRGNLNIEEIADITNAKGRNFEIFSDKR